MTANNFRDLLDPWTLFVADDGHSGLRVTNPDEILARPVPWVDCPTCDALGWVGGPTGDTEVVADIPWCPTCSGTGHPTVAQLLAWGSAVAEPIESPRFPGDDKYDDVADYRNRILGVQP